MEIPVAMIQWRDTVFFKHKVILYCIINFRWLTIFRTLFESLITWSRCRFMVRHQMAGDAHTQNYENVISPFTTILWQETKIHSLMRTFEFNHKIWMCKCCALMLLIYLICQWNQMRMEVIKTAQHFSVKILLSFLPLQQQL